MAAFEPFDYRSGAAERISAPDKDCRMLITLTALAIMLLSATASSFSGSMEEAAQQVVNSPITPRDPSTLALAVIGAGTIAIYLLAKWRPARTDLLHWTARLGERSKQGDPVDEGGQRQSRGAA